MSLLLEALKKAEQAKRAQTPSSRATGEKPPQDNSAFPEISLADPALPEAEPATPEPTFFEPTFFEPTLSEPGFTLTDLPQMEPGEATPRQVHDQPEANTATALSLDFPEPAPPSAPAAAGLPPPAASSTTPSAAPTIAPATTPAINQAAAKKILAAKQGKPQRNLKLLGGILLGATLLGAVAAYYYWQARPQPAVAITPAAVAPRPAAMPPATPQPPAAQPDVPTVEPVVAEEPAAPEKPAIPAKPRKVPPTPANLAMEQPSLQISPTGGEGIRSRSQERVRERERDSAIPERPLERKDSAPTGAPDSGIKIRRDSSDARLDPLLASAYQAFMAGDAKKAENDYRKALQQTPNSRDALLGLAAIAASGGQPQAAANHYLRVLQLDPKDAAAQAGLIGLRGFADPTLSESRLKTLLAQNPDVGYLHFALGNLYAGQARWSEAQEAYFNALHGDSGNADYAFNLAVSLEHLDQRKPALAYYQRALTLVKERPASFDSAQLKKRINELQPLN